MRKRFVCVRGSRDRLCGVGRGRKEEGKKEREAVVTLAAGFVIAREARR